ncbi:MAG: M48 family metallopeptidase [Candidatus Tectomicrobia bacterium]|uniref:M48 family metallopeptidase n=1 Tax=Tectimicrobiota bacterium TaxID=2528274 RepID=A0A932I3Y0_UNCTE|nr:M48 family metallopeptidase [Candidatus Tectomicrobia bacterium]
MFHRLLAFVLAAFLALPLLGGCVRSELTGRQQLLILPPSSEQEMGLTAWQELLKKHKINRDPRINAMVRRVLGRIAGATGQTGYKWEFAVIEDRTPNAFALPGGKVGVHTGILPYTRDETGLAAVIGHEVAHVIARHGGERVSQQLLVNLGLAAVEAGMSGGDPAMVRQVTGLLGAGASVGLILPFSRSHESEADRLGLIYMAKAGYDPRAAVDFWRRMQQAGRGKGKPPEFLSTHPSDETRIRQLQQWLPEAMRNYRP